jgi:hypothetical protein
VPVPPPNNSKWKVYRQNIFRIYRQNIFRIYRKNSSIASPSFFLAKRPGTFDQEAKDLTRMETKVFSTLTVVVVISLLATVLVVLPVEARMIGGPNCVEAQNKLNENTLMLTYHLDCGDEQADVMESPNPVGGPRIVLATVKQRDGNSYLAGDGAQGKNISAATGNHLPQGADGPGQGRLIVLGETWVCNRVELNPAVRDAGGVAESSCQVAP